MSQYVPAPNSIIKTLIDLTLDAGYNIEVIDPTEGDILVEVCNEKVKLIKTCLNLEVFCLNLYIGKQSVGSIYCLFDGYEFPIFDYSDNVEIHTLLDDLITKCDI